MNTETEIKLKLHALPNGLSNPVYIEQTYLDIRSTIDKIYFFFTTAALDWRTITETRIRKKGIENPTYFLTLKTDGALTRNEYEVVIDGASYKDLLNCQQVGKICKNRYTILTPLDSVIIEIDKYVHPISDLVIAEIEFDKNKYQYDDIIKMARSILKEFDDVTFDSKYKNKNIATFSLF